MSVEGMGEKLHLDDAEGAPAGEGTAAEPHPNPEAPAAPLAEGRQPAPAGAAKGSTTEELPPKPAGLLLRMHHGVKEIEPWGILLAVVAFLLSLGAFWIDYSDRVEERTVRAWQLLTTPARGNSGKIAALEYLNRKDGIFCANDRCLLTLKERTPLIGVDLSRGVYLVGVRLRSANLPGANLPGANLSGAALRDADLRDANLAYADLSNADLSDADLSGAKMRNASLESANLLGVILRGVDFRDVNFRNVRQLDQACIDPDTILPPGLGKKIRPCKLLADDPVRGAPTPADPD